MSNSEDQLLWNRFLSGDDEAYAQIYRLYVQSLFYLGMQYTHDRELIKDCIQDIFMKIYKNKSQMITSENLKLYFFITFKNCLFNVFKKNNTFQQIMESLKLATPYEQAIEEDYIIKEEESGQRKKVDEIMDMLTPRQRKAMHYRFVECLTIQEIALLMDMNNQSVQNLIQRSIAKVRKSFPQK